MTMEVFLDLYSELPRMGPGSDASTAKALAMLSGLPEHPRILDVGCGPGMQTLALARLTGGDVLAVDTHQPYLEELDRRAADTGLSARVTTLNRPMEALELDEARFDLIWSEGAIYLMGFSKGLAAWRPLLEPGGYLAVTELTRLVENPPAEGEAFWGAAYPPMKNIPGNLAAIEAAGYALLGHFTLPESDWWDHFYTPLEARARMLRPKYEGNPEALGVFDETRQEIELYRAHSTSYGYVFYVMERTVEQ